jgi:vacuolar-type H+-ATPase subunit H
VPEMSFDRLAASIRDERTGKRPSAPDVQALARQIMTEASREIRETVTSAKEEMTRLTDQLLTKEARQVPDDVRRAILDQRTKLLNVMSGVSKSLREAETSLLEHLKP